MSNLIYQCFEAAHMLDPEQQELNKRAAQISELKVKQYAESIGVTHLSSFDPYILDDSICRPMYQWLRIIYDPLFEQFDDVLFLDSDIVPNTDKNIFDDHEGDVSIVLDIERNGNGVGFNRWDVDQPFFELLIRHHDRANLPIIADERSRMINYNSGVMIFSKEARAKARKCFDNWLDYVTEDLNEHILNGDQYWLTAQLLKYDFDVNEIDPLWNGTMLRQTSNRTDKYWFKHYQHYEGKQALVEEYDEECDLSIHGTKRQS